MSRLGPTSLTQLLTDIKTWILSKLDNYVTTNTAQTITGKKLFTASSIQLDNVTSMSGSTMLINTSAAAPRGEFPAEEHRIGRIYIGDNTSYNGAWFIVDPTISTNRAFYRMVTTNPDNTDSARFTIEWNGTKEGVRRRRNISMGDLICATNNTYNIGEPGNVWKEAYINSIHGTSDFANITSVTLNANTTLTHAVHGRRIIAVTGTRTLTLPVPENGSWFLIKALDYTVTINPPTGTTIASYPDNAQSIVIKAGETVLLTYNGETEYCCVYTTGNSTALVGRTDAAPSEPKNWFKVASCVCKTTYSDPTISFKVYISHSGNTIGTLTAHCRIGGTVGVTNTANTYLQWQECGEGITLDKYAITTKDVSGTSATIELWCKLEGDYASAKFVRIIEHDITNNINKPVWLLTPTRQTDGDLAELSDTDFTNIIYSTLTTLKNNTAGNAKNVTGIVAIANGGTGATTRLNAVKALTNEAVASPTHFLAITTNWGKAGYTTVAQAKTVLGITGDMGSHSDSEYVHKTGDESISGAKTFSSNITINGTYLGTESSINERTNIYLLANRDTADASGAYISRFRQNRTQGAMGTSDVSFISFDFLENSTRYTRCFTMGLTDWDSDGVPQTYYLTSPGGKGSLGTATTAWNKVYANSYYLGTTAFGDIVTHNASEFLTSHPSITLSSNTTSTASPAHGGTFTCIDSVTQDTNGHITKVNTKTVTLPSDNNTDTKVKQYEGTTNNERPILSRYNSTEASQTANFVVYDTGVTSNPAKHTITASGGFIGNASSATKLNTARQINGTDFDGTNDITTAKWGTSRKIEIWDGPGIYKGTASDADGSSDIQLRLPTTIVADNFYGVASSATEFSANKDVTLTGDVTGTASSKAGWSVATTLANSGVTAGDYGPSEDASPAHSGTFTVPSITVDAKGRVTAASTKTITLPSDSNTDTKVTQTVTTGNSAYPVLLCATANATSTGTTTSRFSAGLTVNTRYSSIYITNKYDTANTKGVRNTSNYRNGILYFRSYDNTEMGTIHCESNEGGYQQIYMLASNYIKDGAIDPEGTRTNCSIAVRVRDNGGKTIYTEGSWENSLTPYANDTYDLGTSSLRWNNAYIKNLNLNGNAFDPTSVDGVGTVKLLAYVPTGSQEYAMAAGTTKAGSNLGEVWAYCEGGATNTRWTFSMSKTQSGTWKLLNSVSIGGNPTDCTVIGLWVRIS